MADKRRFVLDGEGNKVKGGCKMKSGMAVVEKVTETHVHMRFTFDHKPFVLTRYGFTNSSWRKKPAMEPYERRKG